MSSCPFAAMLRSSTAGNSESSNDAHLTTRPSTPLAINELHDRYMTRAISAPHLQEAAETSALSREGARTAGDARDSSSLSATQPHELTPPAQSPELSAARKMTRRELRRLERKWTLAEVGLRLWVPVLSLATCRTATCRHRHARKRHPTTTSCTQL